MVKFKSPELWCDVMVNNNNNKQEFSILPAAQCLCYNEMFDVKMPNARMFTIQFRKWFKKNSNMSNLHKHSDWRIAVRLIESGSNNLISWSSLMI